MLIPNAAGTKQYKCDYRCLRFAENYKFYNLSNIPCFETRIRGEMYNNLNDSYSYADN